MKEQLPQMVGNLNGMPTLSSSLNLVKYNHFLHSTITLSMKTFRLARLKQHQPCMICWVFYYINAAFWQISNLGIGRPTFILMIGTILHSMCPEFVRYSQPTWHKELQTSSFTFSELINIIFGPILSPQPETSLLHGRTAKDTASLVFYMNNIFGAFETY